MALDGRPLPQKRAHRGDCKSVTAGKEADCQFQEGSQLRKDAAVGPDAPEFYVKCNLVRKKLTHVYRMDKNVLLLEICPFSRKFCISSRRYEGPDLQCIF